MNLGMFGDMMAAFDKLTDRLDKLISYLEVLPRLVELLEAEREQPAATVKTTTKATKK